MKLCIPFLAIDRLQFDPRWLDQGFGVEASLFDRKHILDPDAWEAAKRNVRWVAEEFRPSTFVFHFPVNECNFVSDAAIEARLFEAFDLVEACGMNGIVVHSNQVHPIASWVRMDAARGRAEFFAYIEKIRQRIKGAPFWFGLENMPIMGNLADEYDPLFVFPADFEGLAKDNLGITWDFCHYSYSVHVAGLLRSGELDEASLYTSVGSEGFFDFLRLRGDIVHYHFSAFEGVASRGKGTRCIEGVAPWQATVPEEVYARAIAEIAKSPSCTVTLEIRERDYRRRELVFEVADWCRRMASNPSAVA